jgi:alkylation response protein AidB-like acyl-CoA dehydrogenase
VDRALSTAEPLVPGAFQLTDAQAAYVAEVRRLARERLAPVVARGTPGRVNRELVSELGSVHMLARLFPAPTVPGERPRAAAFDLCLLREALATVSTESETALALQGLGTYPIVLAGSPRQVDRWVPAVSRGDAVAAYALSEAEAGSDAGALTLRAEREADRIGGWRLTGEKLWISNAPEADVYCVFARTTDGAGSRGVTGFIVPGDRAGLSGEHLDMLSPHPIGRLVFDGVHVEQDEMLGEVDKGFGIAMRTLDLFRPSVGAFAVGMAQAALDASLEYADTREAFGAPLRDLQSVAHTLAEMATRIDAARLLVYRAGAAYDSGHPHVSTTSAMAKLFATETAQWVVDSAIQIHGARALERGHLLEHLYREVRAPRIYEGASEVQRTIIARDLYRGRPSVGSHA